jgi:hypothetical protein
MHVAVQESLEAGDVIALVSLDVQGACCAVSLRKTAWSGMEWAWHGKCESDTAALFKSNGKGILNP